MGLQSIIMPLYLAKKGLILWLLNADCVDKLILRRWNRPVPVDNSVYTVDRTGICFL